MSSKFNYIFFKIEKGKTNKEARTVRCSKWYNYVIPEKSKNCLKRKLFFLF